MKKDQCALKTNCYNLVTVSDTTVVTIESAVYWNRTKIPIQTGGRYRFSTSGMWMDGDISCGAGGYRSPNILFDLVAPFRRYPAARWFELIGGFDEDPSSTFRIGAAKVATATRSGLLTCFANDISLLYFNNSGSIQLTVTRLG
jgi:hypothetical protein